MRSIRIGVPSGKAKMVLWEGTEDEGSFEIKSLQRGIPYVIAHGVKYELTEEEIKHLRYMQKVASCVPEQNSNLKLTYRLYGEKVRTT